MSTDLEVVQLPAATRRSPIAHWHEVHATASAIHESMVMPVAFGASAPQGSALQLRDVSWRRRFGCKGPDAEAWLATQGFSSPLGINRWSCDERGMLVARLTTSEFLIQCERSHSSNFAAMWDLLGSFPRMTGIYPVPRQDFVIEISGAAIQQFLTQVCSVDFRFALRSCSSGSGEVLLTSMVGVAVVVIVRAGIAGPRLTIWSDPTYAHYFWTTLLEVVTDLGGGVAACDAQSEGDRKSVV